MAGFDLKATLINPKGVAKMIDVAALRGAIESALDVAAVDVERDLLSPTATWDTLPTFTTSTPAPGVRLIQTDDNRYHWLDEGTDGPYEIRPKRAGGRLRFSVPFTPKTSASFTSGSGGRGPTVRYVRAVVHPGIKARSWVVRIKADWDRKLQARIDRAIAAALR